MIARPKTCISSPTGSTGRKKVAHWPHATWMVWNPPWPPPSGPLRITRTSRETAAEWGIDPVGLAIVLVAAWAVEHNPGWDQSAERHADRVRRRLLKGVDSDAFSAYFKQFDPEANWGNGLGGGLV